MSTSRRVRRLAEWNATLSQFFTFPITVGQFLLLVLLLSGVGVMLFGLWRQELESGRTSWDSVMLGRVNMDAESRLRRVERVASEACAKLEQGDTAGAFCVVAEADAKVLEKVHGVLVGFSGDTVVLWSGNYSRAVEQPLRDGQQLVRINGMQYYMRATQHGKMVVYAGVGLRSDYPIFNRYLRSGYVPSLSFLEGRSLESFFPEMDMPAPRVQAVSLHGNVQILVAFILILVAIFSAPLLLTRHLNVLVTLICVVCGVGWRYLFLRMGVFDGVLGHLFSPSVFALSRFVPSLGDFLLHALVLLLVTMLCAQLVRFLALSRRIRQTTFLGVCGLGAVVVLLLGDMLLRKIVINSTLTIPPYELASFTWYTQAAYIGLVLWFSSGVLMAALFCRQILHNRLPYEWRLWGALLVVTVLLSISFWYYLAIPFGPSIVLCIVVFASLYVPLRWHRGELPFRGMEFIVGMAVALYVGTCSGVESQRRDQMVREQIAERVGGEPDPLLESMLPQLSLAIEDDGALRRFMVSGYRTHARMRRYFEERYQRDYLNGYDVRLTMCYRDELVLLPDRDEFEDCAAYFGRIVATEGVMVPGSRFYFRRGRTGRISYLGIFPYVAQEQERYLYIELDSKQPNAFWGYPELLVNEPTSRHRTDPSYSTALYEHGKLLMNTGQCGYPTSLATTGYQVGEQRMFESMGYNHVAKELPNDMVALVSRAKVSPFEVMGVDVYLLLLFCLFFSVIFRVSGVLRLKPLIGRGIVGRLQLYMAGVMVLTMALALVIALFTMRKTLEEKNKTLMREKSQTVLASLGEMSLEYAMGGEKENWQLNRALSELSSRLYCDINVYDTLGWLMGSSRMEVFTKSLVGERMNAGAWGMLRFGGASQELTREQIGTLRYESMYIPLRQNGKLLGYVNLPYFTRPDEFKRQFQSFTSLLLDFYAVLTGMMLLLSFVLANAVLEPLAQLRRSVETLTITGENKLVFYDTPDQVGALFRAYNTMLNQLESSAAELAETARQRAWQEMARQIAHDIKNPLTPIRLSLQRVMRLRAAENPCWEDRFVEFSDMLENQIDVLARTANTFSTFAKLAEGHAALVDVREAVHRCVVLNSADTRVRLEEQTSEAPLLAWIDENNLQRMVNNVVINAMQAAAEVNGGRVEVRCFGTEEAVVIEVQDNGPGIPEELQDDIFRVRFTTKSEGSGLGLAIAYAVARACGGNVSFVTCPPSGTVFRIWIPKAHEAVAEGGFEKKE